MSLKGMYTDKEGRKRPVTEKKGESGRRRYRVPKEEKKLEKKAEKDEDKLEKDEKKLEEKKEEKKEDPSGPINIEHPGSLEGWEHGQDENTRHEHIREAYKTHGKAETEKKLAALEVLDKNRDPAVSHVAHADLEWLKREF